MTKQNVLLISLSVIAMFVIAFTIMSNNKPKSYEECIMSELKGVQSDMAARIKANACRSMFPEKNFFDQFDNKN